MADTTTSGGFIVRRGPRGIQGQKGDKGDDGDPGATGSGTIANTSNLIAGDGAGAGVDSAIDPADVITLLGNNSGTNTGDQTNITGNAGTVTTIPNLTGNVTSVGTVTTLAVVPAAATFFTDPLSVPSNQGGWEEYFVTGSDSSTTGQTLVDIAGLVSATLSPGARYEIEAKLMISTSADNTGVKVGLHAGGSGGAATCLLACVATSTSQSSGAVFIIPSIDVASNLFAASSSINGIITIDGFFTTRSSGTPTISLQHLKITSGTSTVRVGSIMRIRKAHA